MSFEAEQPEVKESKVVSALNLEHYVGDYPVYSANVVDKVCVLAGENYSIRALVVAFMEASDENFVEFLGLPGISEHNNIDGGREVVLHEFFWYLSWGTEDISRKLHEQILLRAFDLKPEIFPKEIREKLERY